MSASSIVSAAEIAALESELSLKLPPVYKAFLQKTNGGVPKFSVIQIPGFPGGADLQVWFGVRKSVKTSNLIWNRIAYAGRLPEGLLPIACDSGNNLFCVSARREDADTIYYVDLTHAAPKLYRAASDAEDLARRLVET
jgi:hypothetical protein